MLVITFCELFETSTAKNDKLFACNILKTRLIFFCKERKTTHAFRERKGEIVHWHLVSCTKCFLFYPLESRNDKRGFYISGQAFYVCDTYCNLMQNGPAPLLYPGLCLAGKVKVGLRRISTLQDSGKYSRRRRLVM